MVQAKRSLLLIAAFIEIAWGKKNRLNSVWMRRGGGGVLVAMQSRSLNYDH